MTSNSDRKEFAKLANMRDQQPAMILLSHYLSETRIRVARGHSDRAGTSAALLVSLHREMGDLQ